MNAIFISNVVFFNPASLFLLTLVLFIINLDVTMLELLWNTKIDTDSIEKPIYFVLTFVDCSVGIMAQMMDDDRYIDAEDSSSDEEQMQDHGDEEQQEKTLSLPSVAGSSKRKIKKSEKKRNKLIPVQPGIIRLSGLPYGFFERELFSYFSQFGVVTRLKLIRSKKTGGSRGYAYIEFEDEDVAGIAADTMNGYLMFRSLIKARVVDRTKIDVDKLFRNWKRVFTVKTPSQKRALYNRNRSEEQLQRSNQRRAKKLLAQQQKLAAAGIKYELTDFIPLKAMKEQEAKSEEKTSAEEKKSPSSAKATKKKHQKK